MHYLLLISVEKINVTQVLCHSYISTYSKLLALIGQRQEASECDTNQIKDLLTCIVPERLLVFRINTVSKKLLSFL